LGVSFSSSGGGGGGASLRGALKAGDEEVEEGTGGEEISSAFLLPEVDAILQNPKVYTKNAL